MRTVAFFLGLLVLTAWADVLHQVGRPVPGWWWGWLIFWIFLGLAAGVVYCVRWGVEKYKAGAPATGRGTPASAPAVIRKEGM